jgi:uncharacterized repeat protein (TIGR01451 family)
LLIPPNALDFSQFSVHDFGNAPNTTLPYRVANGGVCSATANSTGATLSIDGTDFSLAFYPTRANSTATAATIVNPNDLDDSTNQWWVASKSVAIWAPLSDFTGALPDTRSLTNTVEPMVAKSITGQNNVEPNAGDNSGSLAATSQTLANFTDVLAPVGTNGAPIGVGVLGVTAAPTDPLIATDAQVNQAFPDQYAVMRSNLNNAGTTNFGPGGYVCNLIDNARYTFADFTNPGITVSPPGVKDPLTGITVLYVRGPAFSSGIKFQLGVGGPDLTGGTWTTMNTTTSEYSNPATTGSAQSDSNCTDASITWYDSVADLTAAGHALNEITRVKATYTDVWPAPQQLYLYIPMKINGLYAYSGTDNAPGGPFAAGTSTLGAMAVTQGQWETNTPGTGAGMRKAADALRIGDTEFIDITKTSPSHVQNAGVQVGEQITYQLRVNATSGTSAHTTTITAWDVLPPGLSVAPGSSTLGGAAIGEPTCATGAWPGGATPPSGTVTAGYTACYWTLANQPVAFAPAGNAAGNLPPLEFRAVLDLATPANTPLFNTAFADSTSNMYAKSVYNVATGFSCNGAVVTVPGTQLICKFSNYTLNALSTPGLVLYKSVDKAQVTGNEPFTWQLDYAALGAPMSNTRVMDILPWNGDGRGTSYSGTLTLAGPIAPPAASVGPPVTTADAAAVVRYTRNAPANIVAAPLDASHNLSGAGTNSATNTNWCTQAQFGSANCPTTLADVTAFMVVPLGTGNLSAGALYRLTVQVQPSGNAAGDVYVNRFIGDSDSLLAHNARSNTVSTTAVARPNVVLRKTATASSGTLIGGMEIDYTITLTNNSTTPQAAGYTFTEVVPAHTTFVSLSGADTDCTTPGVDAGTPCKITINNPIINGTPVQVSFKVKVDGVVPAGTLIVNQAYYDTPPEACEKTGTPVCNPDKPVCTGSGCTPPNACVPGDPACVVGPRDPRDFPTDSPRAIPSLNPAGLLLLALTLLGAGAVRVRRRVR